MIDLDFMVSIINYCKRRFGAEPLRPGKRSKASMVLCHKSSDRWYGIFLKEGAFLLRCSPEHIEILKDLPGFSPALYLDKSRWITVSMDGSADEEMVRLLLLDAFRISDDPDKSELHLLDELEEEKPGAWLDRYAERDEPAQVTFTEVYKDVPLGTPSAERTPAASHDGGRGFIDAGVKEERGGTRKIIDESIKEERGGTAIPETLRKLRAVYIPSYEFGGFRGNNLEFYLQARIAADYEDDHEWDGSFVRFRPVYRNMSLEQLRGYFSWRTKFRRNQGVETAPKRNISFIRVHVFEILCGAGVTPEEGFEQLEGIRNIYRDIDSEFSEQVAEWMHDYVIYYHLKDHVSEELFPELETDRCLAILAGSREAESYEEYFNAVDRLAAYQMNRSAFFNKNRETAAEAIKRVVAEFSKEFMEKDGRTLTDLCFGVRHGEKSAELFDRAIFYDWRSPGRRGAKYERKYLGSSHVSLNDWAGETFTVDDIRSYARRQDGRWKVVCPYEFEKPSKILGYIVRETDRQLRLRLDQKHPLKQGSYGEGITEPVKAALDGYFADLEEAARPHIDIDMSALAAIRRDAAVTRDSLIIDEEDEFDEAEAENVDEAKDKNVPAPAGSAEAPDAADSGFPEPAERAEDVGGADAGPEIFLLKALLDGRPYEDYFREKHLRLSITADKVNEIMMEVIGDTVIEFDGEKPELVEDYEEDVREWLDDNE